MLFLYILISIMAGVTVVIGRIINSNLANKIGTFQGTFINYVVGLFFSLVFLFISSETLNLSSETMKTIPIWAYLGGLVGIVVIMLSNYITPKISSFYLTLLLFIGQLFLGIIIDYFTTKDLSIGKLLGGLLILIGLTYNSWIDKKENTKINITS